MPARIEGQFAASRASQRLADLDRSSHGAERVVLVGSGGAEDSDDHVADDVLDGCAVPDEDLGRHVARPGHDATQRFGVEAVANHGGGSEIQERDRDDLPFPLKPRLAGRWRFESDLRSRWRRLALELGVLAKDRLLELLKARGRARFRGPPRALAACPGTPRGPLPADRSGRAPT